MQEEAPVFSSLQVRNVQEAYVRGLQLVRREGQLEETRNGPALVIPWPVVTIYERPYERVLLDPVRDANPFFHLMESIWMLAGRGDVASLEPFNAGLKRYSDDGRTYHGAYGWRWRNWFEDMSEHSCMHQEDGPNIDQLAEVIELLRANPGDRRVVLQMWDPVSDLGKQGLDFPCNTQCLFRVRRRPGGGWNMGVNDLDMTIFNRSNDAIWGAYGANAVHFSVLQEFVAAAIGCSVGHMYQWSNNLHAYCETLDKVGEPRLYTRRGLGPMPQDASGPTVGLTMYEDPSFRADPLFNPHEAKKVPAEELFRQVEAFWDGSDEVGRPDDRRDVFSSRGISTLIMMRQAYRSFKSKDYANADSCAGEVLLLDWRRACVEWLERRATARAARDA
jgi:thymidylate synthase